jgi:molybdenum cofactor biosynthesis enzyme MoaA
MNISLRHPTDQSLETLYHVTVLSNFARGYDKYSRMYSKRYIGASTYPNQFFLLGRNDLAIGIDKASRLLRKLNLPGDRLLVLQTRIPSWQLRPNLYTGRGRYVQTDQIRIDGLYLSLKPDLIEPIVVEEAYATSLRILHAELISYPKLRPRTFSVLPVAKACQAACRFCFSKTSASTDVVTHKLDLGRVRRLCAEARECGARRFVITGGGEPGLMQHRQLLELIRIGRTFFDKTVLISNGIHLTRLMEQERAQRLREYSAAGLMVLSISRHHHDEDVNRRIMGVDTNTGSLLRTFNAHRTELQPTSLRLICVMQRGGVQDRGAVEAYLEWAVAHGVGEICFKELYVSSTLESAYHANPGNRWALEHQVSLSLVSDTMEERGFDLEFRLPWGSPVYAGKWNRQPLRIAAYTEPTLFWERTQGLARSWNLMADGRCLVSLEDPQSALPETERYSLPRQFVMVPA